MKQFFSKLFRGLGGGTDEDLSRQPVQRVVSFSSAWGGPWSDQAVVGKTTVSADNGWWSRANDAPPFIEVEYEEEVIGTALDFAIPTSPWGGYTRCGIVRIQAFDEGTGEYEDVWTGNTVTRAQVFDFTQQVKTRRLRIEFDTQANTYAVAEKLVLVGRKSPLSLFYPLMAPTDVDAERLAVLCSEECQARREFLIDNLEMFSDCGLVFESRDGQEVRFPFLKSLLWSCPHMLDSLEAEEEEAGEVEGKSWCRVQVDVDHLSFEFHPFLMILLGNDEVLRNMAIDDLISMAVVFEAMGMKDLLWYTAEIVQRFEGPVEDVFDRLFTVFEKMGERNFDDESVRFKNVVSLAAFNRLVANRDEITAQGASEAIKKARRWLTDRRLYSEFRDGSIKNLKDHPSIDLGDVAACAPPSVVVLRRFAVLGRSLGRFSNVIVQALDDEEAPLLQVHIEPLLLGYEFFRLVLRFHGEELSTFRSSRTIRVEGLSFAALNAVCEFATSGEYDPLHLSVLDHLLVVRHAEKYQEQRLLKFALSNVMRIDTAGLSFFQELRETGNVCEDVQAMDLIFGAWASQEHHSETALRLNLARACEDARVVVLESRNEELSERLRSLEEELSTLRRSHDDVLERLEKLE